MCQMFQQCLKSVHFLKASVRFYMICVVTTTSGGHDSWNWAKVTKPNVNKTCPVFHYTRDNQHISATYKSPSFLRNHRHVKSQVCVHFVFPIVGKQKKD